MGPMLKSELTGNIPGTALMITHIYICNHCEGDVSSRTFEKQFNDIHEAQNAETPDCPRCGSSSDVSRFFGHKLFTNHRRPDVPSPHRFVPLKPKHHTGIVSIGIRTDEENRQEVEEQIEKLIEATNVELVEPSPDSDVPEEVFGLKKGTVERALFDLRQKRMLQDLEDGEPISGFFMPLSGEFSN